MTKRRQNSGKTFWSWITAILTSILRRGHLTRKMDASGYPVVTGKFTMSSARGTLTITFVNREQTLTDTLILMIYFDIRTFRFEKNRQPGDSEEEFGSVETDIWLEGNLTLKDTFNRTTTVSPPYAKINRE